MWKNRKGEELFRAVTYLTDRQMARIQTKADEKGISVSTYLKLCGLKGF